MHVNELARKFSDKNKVIQVYKKMEKDGEIVK